MFLLLVMTPYIIYLKLIGSGNTVIEHKVFVKSWGIIGKNRGNIVLSRYLYESDIFNFHKRHLLDGNLKRLHKNDYRNVNGKVK